jgi:acetoin utilization deacetylase AcuC-like enzyme
MGFCLYNSVAVAARHARDAHGCARTLILDWDVHHGNGTQEIFYDTDEVLFVSIHESPLYPGTGAASERGVGAGAEMTLNLPVPAGTGDAAYLSLIAHVVVPAATAYRPELILISAGYDAHVRDPLASCAVTTAGFATMGLLVRGLADDLGVPLGMVLEGGYDLDALGSSVVATLRALTEDAPVDRQTVPEHPLAAGFS